MEDPPALARARERLSPGRHGLTREEVAASQRGRLLAAMAEVTAEKGYGATTVADVLKRAKVSRLTFYQHFSDKQDCFAAAYDAATEVVTDVLNRALHGGDPAGRGETGPWDAVERAVGAYLDMLVAEPVLARLFLVEVYAVGPELLGRRIALHASVADTFAELVGASSAERRLICEALVGAVVSLATARVAQGDLEGLAALRARVGVLVRGAERSMGGDI